jgi:hypothetical protein
MKARLFTAEASHASDRKNSTPKLRQETAALLDFDPSYARAIAGLSALENLRITVTLGVASECRLASTRCPIAEPAVGRASSTPKLLAAYPL